MTKFGDLITRDVPVLLGFYSSRGPAGKPVNNVLQEVAAALGKKAGVLRIDIEKNEELAAELEIKSVPAYFIYCNGHMVWRHTGKTATQTLIEFLQ